MEETRKKGLVKRFFRDRGYGFAALPDGREVFFHASEVKNPTPALVSEGDAVEFAIAITSRGVSAKDVLVRRPETCDANLSEPGTSSYPAPPDPALPEWSGTPIGVSNTITAGARESGPGPAWSRCDGNEERALAARVGLRLPSCAFEAAGRVGTFPIKLLTSSGHLANWARENWFAGATGPVSDQGSTLYAVADPSRKGASVHVNEADRRVILFNPRSYADIRAAALTSVAQIGAREAAVHSVRAAAVVRGGKAVLFLGSDDAEISACALGLMADLSTAILGAGRIHLRYCYRSKAGDWVAPLSVHGHRGEVAAGHRAHGFIEDHTASPSYVLHAVRTTGDPVRLLLGDLDFDAGVKAFAYPAERRYYLRTDLVERFPESLPALLACKLENVPDVDGRLADRRQEEIEELRRRILKSPAADAARQYGNDLPNLLARLAASPNARALLDPAIAFGEGRAALDPASPVEISTAFLVQPGTTNAPILESLGLHDFLDRLLTGTFPFGDGCRAGDPDAEARFLGELRSEVRRQREPGGAGPSAYGVFRERLLTSGAVPEGVEREIEGYRWLHRAAPIYALDPSLSGESSLRHAHERTSEVIRIVDRVLDRRPRVIRLTSSTYRAFLQ